MHRKKLLWNTLTVLINQIVTVLCAFILPRAILHTYGSEVNGLVSSLTQFLSVISFMDLGIGAVVQASLYKPLSDRDNQKISMIMSSANKFFVKIACGILVYVVSLIVIYPRIVKQSFDCVYTATLILSMCISYFSQYFFGLRYQLLLTADQKGYIVYIINSALLIANNVVGVCLIYNGAKIQIVKLATSLILLIKPLILELYIKEHYAIDRKIQYDKEPIQQKWNGVAQHIATVILTSTDTIVLTFLSTLSNVSIYNVYHLVTNGINGLIVALTSGYLSMFGNMISRGEGDVLRKSFDSFETLFHFIVTYVYGCVLVLIIPFVQVYTKGVTDVNYCQPVFAFIITVANAFYCYRLPYNTLVKAAGHFKQTQTSAIIEAGLNIVISIAFVFKFGLVGVAVGTLIAMVYKTIYLVWYLKGEIIKRSSIVFVKHMIVDSICFLMIFLMRRFLNLRDVSVAGWIILALKIAPFYLVMCFGFNFLLFRGDFNGFQRLREHKSNNKELIH